MVRTMPRSGSASARRSRSHPAITESSVAPGRIASPTSDSTPGASFGLTATHTRSAVAASDTVAARPPVSATAASVAARTASAIDRLPAVSARPRRSPAARARPIAPAPTSPMLAGQPDTVSIG